MKQPTMRSSVTGKNIKNISPSFLLLSAEETNTQPFDGNKLFVHSAAVSRWLSGRMPAPINMELDLTLNCNDACPHCIYRSFHRNRSLSLDTILRLLDEASQLGIRGLTISGGGDPLMHPDALSIFRAIKKYNFDAGLFTNCGCLHTDQLADVMVSAFKWIRVSLDCASEKTFRKIRGHSGFQKRMDSIKRLADAAKRAPHERSEIGISFLTASTNGDDIFPAAELAKKLGFDYIQFKPMIKWQKNQHLSLIFNQEHVPERIRETLTLQDNTFRVLFSRAKYDAEFLDLKRHYSAFHCAWFIVTIGPNLDGPEVRPTLYLASCSKYDPLWKIGEFDSLPQILHSRNRRDIIAETSSDVLYVPSEKHGIYNHLLEEFRVKNINQTLSEHRIRELAPSRVIHPYSL